MSHKGLRCWEWDFVLIAVAQTFVHHSCFKVCWSKLPEKGTVCIPKSPPHGKGLSERRGLFWLLVQACPWDVGPSRICISTTRAASQSRSVGPSQSGCALGLGWGEKLMSGGGLFQSPPPLAGALRTGWVPGRAERFPALETCLGRLPGCGATAPLALGTHEGTPPSWPLLNPTGTMPVPPALCCGPGGLSQSARPWHRLAQGLGPVPRWG